MRIYTRKGDDGTTGLLFGGRVRKDSARIELEGAVDEAQAALGMARAEAARRSELDELLVALERELYVLMAEVATEPANRAKLQPGTTSVTPEMVAGLERRIDDLGSRTVMPKEFVVPGQNRRSAALDLARVAVRRAERVAVAALADAPEAPDGPDGPDGPGRSLVTTYLNRLSDLVWTMARWQEGDEHLQARGQGARREPGGPAAP